MIYFNNTDPSVELENKGYRTMTVIEIAIAGVEAIASKSQPIICIKLMAVVSILHGRETWYHSLALT